MERGMMGNKAICIPCHSHASENPMLVIVDEPIGHKYMLAVDHKGLEARGAIAG